MFKEFSKRNISLGMCIKDNKLLVQKGYDKVKDLHFYRSPGGGIEEGETAAEALKREFKEEMNLDIIINKELGIIDNKFIYNGKKRHEIIYLFDISISDNNFKEKYLLVEDNHPDSYAVWIDINEFKTKEKILFPDQIFEYLY